MVKFYVLSLTSLNGTTLLTFWLLTIYFKFYKQRISTGRSFQIASGGEQWLHVTYIIYKTREKEKMKIKSSLQSWIL